MKAFYADTRLATPIALYGPPGTADRPAHFLTNTTVGSPVESAFAIKELQDGHSARVGALTLTSRAVSHGMSAFALRVEVGGRSLVYSGETAPDRRWRAWPRGATCCWARQTAPKFRLRGAGPPHAGENR
ncbi:hypothetical protein GCM10009546_29260 [Actinomadura livida]|uniref:Uncharacterized protein n=1 Tax=Actinomadura livida TaxID=79909 RepID=A0ABN1EFP0_9ACTN|nr:hypothetical protein GCM10010208_33920 [Actinomadura livida]